MSAPMSPVAVCVTTDESGAIAASAPIQIFCTPLAPSALATRTVSSSVNIP